MAIRTDLVDGVTCVWLETLSLRPTSLWRRASVILFVVMFGLAGSNLCAGQPGKARQPLDLPVDTGWSLDDEDAEEVVIFFGEQHEGQYSLAPTQTPGVLLVHDFSSCGRASLRLADDELIDRSGPSWYQQTT